MKMAAIYKYLGIFVFVVGLVFIPIIAMTLTISDDTCKNTLKLVIDQDGGADDAMAIFMALLNERNFHGPELIALTTSNGNVKEDQVFINSQRILDIAKRRDIPIYRGSQKSIVHTFESDFYYGYDGLGDTDYHSTYEPIEAQEDHAVPTLIKLSKKYEGNLVIVCIGPLTNLAMAVRLDPNFLQRISHIYVGAGHLRDENHPHPEFNALIDVEAYHIVVSNATPEKVTVIPFSQTNSSCNIPRQWREELLGSIDTDIIRAMNAFESVTLPQSERWDQLDPSVMAIVLNNKVVNETMFSNNSIILCGEERGININTLTDEEKANVKTIYSINEEIYKQFLLDLFSSDL